MKRYALTALVLVSSLGLVTSASADTLFEEPNVVVDASFYASDPSGDASILNSVQVNNSPFGVNIPNIESAAYVILEHEGQSYTFELAESGTNKDTIELLVSDEETMTLSAVVAGLVDDPALLEDLSS